MLAIETTSTPSRPRLRLAPIFNLVVIFHESYEVDSLPSWVTRLNNKFDRPGGKSQGQPITRRQVRTIIEYVRAMKVLQVTIRQKIKQIDGEPDRVRTIVNFQFTDNTTDFDPTSASEAKDVALEVLKRNSRKRFGFYERGALATLICDSPD